VSTGSDAGPPPIRGRSESCSEWRCAADAWSLPQLVPVHLPIGPTSLAGSGSSRRISRGRLLAAVGVKMRRQPGHRGHLRLGQRRQRGSRRCRPRPEVLSRRPPHGTVAGAAYGLLPCWPVPSVRRVGPTRVGGTNRSPFLPSHSSTFRIAASGKRILSPTVRTLMTRVRHRSRPPAGAGPLWLSCQPPRRQRWRADRETPLSLRRGRHGAACSSS